MIGAAREIAAVTSWPDQGHRWVRIILGGGQQPLSVRAAGIAAFYHEGAWLVRLPAALETGIVAATWESGPPLEQAVSLLPSVVLPRLNLQPVEGSLDTFELSWPTANGHVYELQHSSDLQHWMPVAGATYFGTGDPATRIEPVSGPRAFFRLDVRSLGN